MNSSVQLSNKFFLWLSVNGYRMRYYFAFAFAEAGRCLDLDHIPPCSPLNCNPAQPIHSTTPDRSPAAFRVDMIYGPKNDDLTRN